MRLGSRLATNLFLGLFLAVQLLLPLRSFVSDKHDTRGNFTWNMYSRRYDCRAGYRWIERDGTTHVVQVNDYLARSSGLGKLYYPAPGQPRHKARTRRSLRR